MAVDSWPETLPTLFLQEGYGEQEPENRLVSDSDAGPAKMRPRSSAKPREITAAMMMTSAQKATLRAFVAETLMQGALPFSFPDPDDGPAWLVRFADGGLPAWTPYADLRWRASFKLEVFP